MAVVLIPQARKGMKAQRSPRELNISSVVPGVSSLDKSSEPQSIWIDAGVYISSVLK